MKQIITALSNQYPEDKKFIKEISFAFNNVSTHGYEYEIGFLDIHLLKLVELISKQYTDVYLKVDYLFDEQEKCFCTISKNKTTNLSIVVLKIDYNKKFSTIRHQDILGFLLNNGYEARLFGDIMVDDASNAFILVSSNAINDFIKSINKIGNITVNLEQSDLPNFKNSSTEIKIIISSSLRVDNIISSIINTSRGKSSKLIKSKFVQINHTLVKGNNVIVKDGDIISIRKHGRYIIENITKTKKGNYRLSVR